MAGKTIRTNTPAPHAGETAAPAIPKHGETPGMGARLPSPDEPADREPGTREDGEALPPRAIDPRPDDRDDKRVRNPNRS